MGKKYFDEENGNIHSEEKVHKVIVPMEVLDSAKSYKIFFKRVLERLAYFPTSEEPQSKSYNFKPVGKKNNLKIYMISDTHSDYKYASKSGKYFEDDLDLLIFNGDIADNCNNIDSIMTLYKIASNITRGEIPVVFARGNHDTRGQMAPYLYKYIGTDKGNMFFTFKVGRILGIVLDCGEDKPDSNPEYGRLANFHEYRLKQIDFLNAVLKNPDYNSKDILYKIAICHIRININGNEFEKEVYGKWIETLNSIGIDAMLCGHEHKYHFIPKDSMFFNDIQIKFPIVIGSISLGNPNTDDREKTADFIGTALELNQDYVNIKFTNSRKEILGQNRL